MSLGRAPCPEGGFCRGCFSHCCPRSKLLIAGLMEPEVLVGPVLSQCVFPRVSVQWQQSNWISQKSRRFSRLAEDGIVTEKEMICS